MMGLLPKKARRSATKLQFRGMDLEGLTERQMSDLRGASMAMIFQEPMTSLNPAYTIGNQLEEIYLRHNKAPRSEARDGPLPLKGWDFAAASRLSNTSSTLRWS